MKSNPSLPQLFGKLPAAFADDFDIESPWLLLEEPLSRALDALPSEKIEVPLDPRINLWGDRIVIGKGSRIHPGATIEGPIRIGRNAEVGSGAVLRGGTWLEDNCVVGTNTEVQSSILMDSATAPHSNYIGDSLLGAGVSLGAGTVLSSQRTGQRRLGAILGDEVEIGQLCGLAPGTTIGRGSRLQSGVHLPAGIYPAESLINLVQAIEIVDKPR
ncbi:MAG: DapH/DapD/GlmU-related protein [Thermoanaerobaculia bacterium]